MILVKEQIDKVMLLVVIANQDILITVLQIVSNVIINVGPVVIHLQIVIHALVQSGI